MGLFGLFKNKKAQSVDTICDTASASVENIDIREDSDMPNKAHESGRTYEMSRNTTDISLSNEQLQVYNDIIHSSDNYFVTGKAGTGKSVLLKHLAEHSNKRLAIVAPTGIAAINVSGQTIHSFFGLGTTVQTPENPEMLYKGLSDKRKKLFNSLEMLIIDEISMVRVDVMDMIDSKMRVARNCNAPFGGCQIVVFGDLFQLPPVVGKEKEVQEYLENKYHTLFFFGAPGVREKPFITVELSNVFRQKDNRFIDLLNNIRVGNVSNTELSYLNQRVVSFDNEELITLTATNSAATEINLQNLEALQTKEYSYDGTIEGDFLESDLPTDYTLRLKVGAQVIMIKNDSDRRWVNGSIGHIAALEENLIKVSIAGATYSVDKEVWTKYRYAFNEEKKTLEHIPVGSFKQFPVRLAYAITIHKSQGQTYDAVAIDYQKGRAFASGQTYVALSRCKQFDKLFLTDPIIEADIKVNQEIITFMDGHLKLPSVNKTILPPAPIVKVNAASTQWKEDGTLQINDDIKPNKVTGTRLPKILGMDKYNSPFKTWCDMMGIYKEPFKENQFTIAGKKIEPKQFEFVKKALTHPGREFIRPEDIYGEDAKDATGYDFFSSVEDFGGMWDYLIKDNGKITAVLEMKTKQEKNRAAIMREYPKDLITQGALYAFLLNVPCVYMVTSFIKEAEYDNPDSYICTKENTVINRIDINLYFRNFESSIIAPAHDWLNRYVKTGVSPVPDKIRDKPIIDRINHLQSIRCPSCGSHDFSSQNEIFVCNHCGSKFKDYVP